MDMLHNVVNVAAIMHQMVTCFEDDFTLGITDTETFLHYIPGKTLQFGLSRGESIREGSLANTILKQGKPISRVMDSSVYGIAYIAGGLPLFHEGKVAGTLVFGVSLDRQNKLAEISQHLSAIAEQVSAQSQAMQNGAEALSVHSEKQFHVMTRMIEQLQSTFSVLQSISQIAKHSEILGLNASIEAARVGEHGRGFTIVTGEIRRLAARSGNLAKEISAHLMTLQTEIAAISEMVHATRTLSQAQMEGMGELASAIQEITEESLLLQQMSQIHSNS